MTQAELERIKIDEIADAYRAKGYVVHVHPTTNDLPPFLAPFQPDLIAKSMTDNVVVQARSSSALKSTMLIELADAIDGKPGWRLELAVVNTPVTPDLPHNGELVPNERVETLLRDARALVAEKRLEAALLTGWAAAEAVLRRLAQTKGVDAEKKGSGTILKQVLVFGLITPDQYIELSRAMDARNAFAHGFIAQIDAEAVDRFLKEIDVLRAPRAA